MRATDARSAAANRIAATLLLCGAISLLAVAASWALEPGVHADPGSPAAKEYALPLPQARQTGSRRGGGLFGAGIRRTAPAGSSRSGHGPKPSAREQRHGGVTLVDKHGGPSNTGSASNPEGSTPSAALKRTSNLRPGSGDGSLLALLGGAVAVLALAVIGGTLLRGRRTTGPAGQ